ncbi:MAG: hydantoinase B/oxoprolinase family protein [Dehalococcoidia bacterium]|nr:hydantoinase B/oxoprolinase family protein [Dehalococcoidia bacterium]
MQLDPVSLDIIWSRLIGICEEAKTAQMRTESSLIVIESQDLCCVLVDAKGDAVAQGLGRIPFIILPRRVRSTLVGIFDLQT